MAKYLATITEAGLSLKSFRHALSECLNADLLLGMTLKHKLLISLNNEEVGSLSVTDKRQLIRDLSISNGTTFDKIRLHEGKSTTNNLHQIQINMVHEGLHSQPSPLRIQEEELGDGRSGANQRLF